MNKTEHNIIYYGNLKSEVLLTQDTHHCHFLFLVDFALSQSFVMYLQMDEVVSGEVTCSIK